MMQSPPIVWTIAGSDSRGLSGIQADLKTFHSLGVHGCTVITAVTAQAVNQLGDIQFIDIAPQIKLMQQDFYPRVIKIGMLGTISLIETLRGFLETYSGEVILDPVLATSAGGSLFQDEHYLAALKSLLPFVTVLTPNTLEAAQLLQRDIHSTADMMQAACDLLALGAKSVLLKGGHLPDSENCCDYWTNSHESFWMSSKRQQNVHFNGTGCTLASAVASALALGYDIKDALVIAKMFINQAMRLSLQCYHSARSCHP